MVKAAARVRSLVLGLLLVLAAGAAWSATWTIQVKGVDPDGPFRFMPDSLSISYGDTVRWVWVSGAHSTTNHDGVACDGGLVPFLWRAPIDQFNPTYTYVFAPPAIPAVDSTYYYECEPHCSFGMNGRILLRVATGVEVPPVYGQAPFSWGTIKSKMLEEKAGRAETSAPGERRR